MRKKHRITTLIACIALLLCIFVCACTHQSQTPTSEDSVSQSSSSSSTSEEEEQQPSTFTLTATATGCSVTFKAGKETIIEGETVVFTVAFDGEIYDENTLAVTLNGEPVTGDKQTDGKFIYESENVCENIEVVASIQKYTYTVTFCAPQGFGFWNVVKTYEHGEQILDEDIPLYFETGWQCVWEIPTRTVTQTAIYYPFVCKTLATPEEIFKVERTQNYILIKDIDFSGITLTAKQNGAVIPFFDGVLIGNGYALKNLTFTGTETKHLFGTLSRASLRNVRLENCTFAGTDTVYGQKAYGCAPIGCMDLGTTLTDCYFEVCFTAGGAEEKPNAGLVYSLIDGHFTNCTLVLQTNAQPFICEVCCKLSDGAVTDGVSVQKR